MLERSAGSPETAGEETPADDTHLFAHVRYNSSKETATRGQTPPEAWQNRRDTQPLAD